MKTKIKTEILRKLALHEITNDDLYTGILYKLLCLEYPQVKCGVIVEVISEIIEMVFDSELK